MPIYEFFSPTTGKIYSFFARSTRYADKVPFCPDGKKCKMTKMLSGFSVTGNDSSETENEIHSSDQDNPFEGMDPRQSNRIMKELEGAMSGMDDENPDPRHMGNLMRKMCEMTGEKMNGQMEEVVRKLEEGMDPNELEQEMGEFLEEDEPDQNPAEPDATSGNSSLKGKRGLARLVRDPVLYEFSDFI